MSRHAPPRQDGVATPTGRGSRALGWALVLALACAPRAAAQGTAPVRDTLTIGVATTPAPLDPVHVSGRDAMQVVRAVAEGLVARARGGTIVPGLAEAWTTSPDGLRWTFRLRRGVVFHDGTPLDAGAAARELRRHLVPETASPWTRALVDEVAAIQVSGPLALTVQLVRPAPGLLGRLAHPALAVARFPAATPVGTGPFVLAAPSPDGSLVLERNVRYWGTSAAIGRVVFRPFPDPKARARALREGVLDIALDLPAAVLEPLERDRNLVIRIAASTAVTGVALDTRHPALRDRRVRQALNHAVARRAVWRQLGDTAAVADGPLSRAWGDLHPTGVLRYAHDPNKAKALLRDAGYPRGLDLGLLVPAAGPGHGDPAWLAGIVRANLGAVGVRTRLDAHRWPDYLRRLREGRAMALVTIQPALPDPDLYLSSVFGTARSSPDLNPGQYVDPRVERLLASARGLADGAARVALYREAEHLLADDAPWIFLHHPHQVVVHRRELAGLELAADFDLRLPELRWRTP